MSTDRTCTCDYSGDPPDVPHRPWCGEEEPVTGTPAATLREAASRMRALAEATGAVDERWYVDVDGSLWRTDPEEMSADGITGPLPIWAAGYATHLAAWSPAVALAVADWLEHAAARAECKIEHGGGRDPVWSHERDALAVARVFLGTDR